MALTPSWTPPCPLGSASSQISCSGPRTGWGLHGVEAKYTFVSPLVLSIFFSLQGQLAFTCGGNKLLATLLREVGARVEGRAGSGPVALHVPSPLWPSPGGQERDSS